MGIESPLTADRIASPAATPAAAIEAAASRIEPPADVPPSLIEVPALVPASFTPVAPVENTSPKVVAVLDINVAASLIGVATVELNSDNCLSASGKDVTSGGATGGVNGGVPGAPGTPGGITIGFGASPGFGQGVRAGISAGFGMSVNALWN